MSRSISGGNGRIIGREVDVVTLVAAPEGIADIGCERQPVAETFGQIGVGREVSAERDRVCVAASQDRFGAVAIEAAGGNDRPLEDLPE